MMRGRLFVFFGFVFIILPNAAYSNHVVITECLDTQYFDFSALQCSECGNNQVASSNGRNTRTPILTNVFHTQGWVVLVNQGFALLRANSALHARAACNITRFAREYLPSASFPFAVELGSNSRQETMSLL